MANKVQFNVYLPPELVREVKHRSIDDGLSLSSFVQRALERELTRDQAQQENPDDADRQTRSIQ